MLKTAGNKSAAFHNRFSWLLTAISIAALIAGMSVYKIHKIKTLPFFNAKDGKGFYWTEAAFHFRYARMVAEGKKIPQSDVEIQYPEGLDTIHCETPVMEWIAGSLYRLFSIECPLHVFLIYFSSILSSFSILAIFLTGKFLWRSNWAGFIAACFYSFAPASFARTAGGPLLREDFALGFIFFSFACFIYCLKQDRPIVATAGTLLLTMALAAWHGTQFYVIIFVTGFVLIFLLRGSKNLPRLSFTVFSIIMAAAAMILPLTRTKLFAFSPQMMMCYGLTIALWLLPRISVQGRLKEIAYGGGLVLIFITAGIIIQKHAGGYSHIYNLIWDKIAYFSKIPENGTKLSFDTKIEWSAGNVTPNAKEVLMFLSGTILLGTMGAIRTVWRVIRHEEQAGEIMSVYAAACTFILFLMVHRFSVFTVFFLALLAGSLALIRNRAAKILSYTGMPICLICAIYILCALNVVPFRPSHECVVDAIDFIKTNGIKNQPVLTSFELGPSIAAYAEHPVILHSKFETDILREKVRDIYSALYQDEEDFYQTCRKYGAKLFVYQTSMILNSNIGSIRYAVDAIPLRKNCAAFLFQFAPEKLKHFHLVHQNFTYRIFLIDGEAPAKSKNLLYEPLYDLNVYCVPETLGEYISDSIIASGYYNLQRPDTHMKLGDKFFSAGDYRTAILEYLRVLALEPGHTKALQNLAESMYKSNDVNDLPDAGYWIMFGSEELTAERYSRAEKFFTGAIQLKPDSSEAHIGLGITSLRQGKLKKAEKLLLLAISYNPTSYAAYENLAKVYLSTGDNDKAIETIKKSLLLNPHQPLLTEVLKELKKSVREQNIRKKN